MRLSVTSPPALPPISKTEAKLHLRVDHADDDTLIDSLIEAAWEYAETVTRRAFMVRSYRLHMDAFPTIIELPKPPVLGVTSITYVDIAGTTTTLAAATYALYKSTEPAWIEEAYGQSWPAIRDDTDGVQVNFAAGYAVTVTFTNLTNLVTPSGYMFDDDDIVWLFNRDGGLPTGLLSTIPYYVINAGAATLQLSLTSGGAAVTFTTDGTGENFIGMVPEGIQAAIKMLVGHWYEHREAATDGFEVRTIPMAVKALLSAYSMPEADT